MNLSYRKILQYAAKCLVLGYIFLLPLGQLLKIPFPFGSNSYSINIADLFVLLAIPLTFLIKIWREKAFSPLFDLIFVLLAGIVISGYALGQNMIPGLLYLVRFISYIFFSILVYHLVREKILKARILMNYLFAFVLFAGLVGLIQYFLLPDLRFLRLFGWDDHLYRLAGTFLDPSFTAIILLLGFVISLIKIFESDRIRYISFTVFFGVLIFLTYSRAGIIALFASILFLVYAKKLISTRIIIFGLSLFSLGLLLLPNKPGEGTKLLRTQSIFAKYSNYTQTLQITVASPVFGLGFGNLCGSNIKRFNTDPKSHACSGSDSSLLYMLAGSGIIGLLVFLDMFHKLSANISTDSEGLTLKTFFVGLAVHSLFVQSVFYTFTMGILAILYAVSLPRVRFRKKN